jgi:hypothetical protein
MMQPERARGRSVGATAVPRRRLWPVFVPAGIVVVLAVGWSLLWFHAASVAERTIAGWMERESEAGRAYSCGSQSIGGFPFRIEFRCTDIGAELRDAQPPFAVKAKHIVVAAQVYQPTLLISEVTGPLTLGLPQRPPDFAANWTLAQVSVRGLPPAPERVSFAVDKPHVDRIAGGRRETVFEAGRAELHGRVASGSPGSNPVIEAVLRLAAAAVPNLHPLVAQPFDADVTAVLRGLQDFAPKPWTERFREIQAAGGNIEITRARVQREDIIAVAAGTLTLNPRGRLDGLVRIAIVGIEDVVPLLGVERLIGQGLDRLTGANGPGAQGLGGLDRLLPGLSGVVRQTTNATLIENLKKMGEPTEIDNKPAVVLPLRLSDGLVYLGMIPLGQVPPLF